VNDEVTVLRQRVRDTQEALGAAMAPRTDNVGINAAQAKVLQDAHDAWMAYYEAVRVPADGSEY
jgi:hypothetical protein